VYISRRIHTLHQVSETAYFAMGKINAISSRCTSNFIYIRWGSALDCVVRTLFRKILNCQMVPVWALGGYSHRCNIIAFCASRSLINQQQLRLLVSLDWLSGLNGKRMCLLYQTRDFAKMYSIVSLKWIWSTAPPILAHKSCFS